MDDVETRPSIGRIAWGVFCGLWLFVASLGAIAIVVVLIAGDRIGK